MDELEVSPDELRFAFNTLKPNKSSGLDDISPRVVKEVFNIIEYPLLIISNLSFNNGVFPNLLKLARVVPIFKDGNISKLANYRPISILPFFSKILERIMHNRLYNYFTKHNLLNNNQYGFRKGHSTEHAVIKLVKEILNGFENNQYTLGVFIDLSKAFDTVDHNILLCKLKNYGVKNNNYKWFCSYLKNRKQCVSYDKTCTKLESISCGVPQGSILGPLLFLIYINDIYLSSSILNFNLFADDTQVFYTHSNIKSIFITMNRELDNLNEWLKANKLSLNKTKSKYILFSKSSKSETLPLKLPDISIEKTNLQRTFCIKFLGVLLDEQISWKDHINLIENKISKSIGIMYKTRHMLDKNCLKLIYYSFIHSYINYCNIAWASTYPSKLTRILNKQKHASRLILNANKYTSANPLLRKLGVLNVYQLNIYSILLFMFRFKYRMLPNIFEDLFFIINHKYQTKHSLHNYQVPKTSLKQSNFSITYRGPHLWNSFLPIESKTIISMKTFKSILKKQLLDYDLPQILFYF
ncbi:MAG: reverse transcriptase family protein [Rickettsiales bacterium]|nr:reverse transcriptase family protein [Rickettsiales bacterium]